MWFFFQFIAVLILAESLANPEGDASGRFKDCDSKTIFNAKYKYKNDLGEGATSIVVEAEVIGHPNVHKAIKIIDKREECKKYAEQEIKVLAEIGSHSSEHFIIRMDDSFDHLGHKCIVLEKLDQSLDNLLFQQTVQRVNARTLSLEQKSRFAYQLCIAVKFLHDKRIVHRDIKVDNVLLARGNREVRLSDFGLAKIYGSSAEEDAELEVYKARDVVLIGSTVLQMFDLFSPFIDWQMNDQNDLNRALDEIKKIEEECKDLHDFLEMILKRNPHERMTLAQALKHPFLNKFSSH